MEGVLLTFSSLHGEAAGLSRPDKPAMASASQVGLERLLWNDLDLTQCFTYCQTSDHFSMWPFSTKRGSYKHLDSGVNYSLLW